MTRIERELCNGLERIYLDAMKRQQAGKATQAEVNEAWDNLSAFMVQTGWNNLAAYYVTGD